MATGEYVTRNSCRGNDSSGYMASNAAVGVNTGKYYDQRITWTTTKEEALLRTKVVLNYYARCNNSIAYTECVWIPTIGGTVKSNVSLNINYTGYTNNWKYFGSHTYYVNHNATTGTASTVLTASFRQTQLASYPYALRDGSISYTLQLEPIAVDKMPYMKNLGSWGNKGSVLVKSGGTWQEAKPQSRHAGTWKDPVE